MKYNRSYLIIYGLFITLYACSSQSTKQPEAVPLIQTAMHISQTAKDIFERARKKTHKLTTRAKQEVGYFVQEVRSFFRNSNQILLKQPPDKVAQLHKTICIIITLPNTDNTKWQPIADMCTTESEKFNNAIWKDPLETICHALRTEASQLQNAIITYNFLRYQTSSVPRPSTIEKYKQKGEIAIVITFTIKKSTNEPAWIALVKNVMQIMHNISNQEMHHKIDSIYHLITESIQQGNFHSLCIK